MTVEGSGPAEGDRSADDRFGRPEALPIVIEAPETFAYRVKCRLLGPPLTNVELKGERLSKRTALGVLSSDCISSSAYGSEEILLVLIPLFGLSAYTLLLPMTGIVLVVLVLVTLTYRWVVTTYTAAGGSYVVARENFGPVVAQVGAVALMLDYIVTVAVQASAGTAAVTSAIPALERLPARDHRRRGARPLLREPARAPGGRPAVRVPHVLLHRLHGRRHRRRAGPRDPRRPAALRPDDRGRCVPCRRGEPAAEHRRGLHPHEVVRERRLLAHRARGDLQRGQHVPPAPGAQRPPDAGHHERAARHARRRRLLAGPRDPRRRLRERLADGDLPGGQGGPRATRRSAT